MKFLCPLFPPNKKEACFSRVSGFLYIKFKNFLKCGIQIIDNKQKSIKFIIPAKIQFIKTSIDLNLKVFEFIFPLNIFNADGKNCRDTISFIKSILKNKTMNIIMRTI